MVPHFLAYYSVYLYVLCRNVGNLYTELRYMANLFKKPRSPFWYGRFQFKDPDKERPTTVIFSTKKTEKKEARTVLNTRLAICQGQVSGFTLLSRALEQVQASNDPAEKERTLDVLFNHVLEYVASILDQKKQDDKRRQLAGLLLQGTTSKLAVADAWAAWVDNPKKRNPGERTLSSYQSQCQRLSRPPLPTTELRRKAFSTTC